MLLGKLNKEEDKSVIELPYILTLSEILARSENYTLGNTITFSKSKTVTSLMSFSKIVKTQKQNKTNVCTNLRNQKYKKALIIKFDERNSDKKSINKGIQFSESKYDNNKYLLLGGTETEKKAC